MALDVIVFAAHPDDAELSMGGTIAKLTKNGIKVGIIDLSEAHLSTRGSVDERKIEADNASKILGLTIRENLNLPDGNLKPDMASTKKIISRIRKYKPKIIFGPYFNDRHPDHVGTSQLIKDAMFFSGLTKIETEDAGNLQEAYRPNKLYYFMQTYDFTPSFIVDISDTYATKVKSIEAFASQFHNPQSKEPDTFISQPNFLKYLEARAKVYGFQIGADFGEPFFCEERIQLDLIHQIKNL